MARMPGKPVGDDGQPIFPNAADEPDEVAGHMVTFIATDEEGEEDDGKPKLAD